jgi:DNA-binding transcriptional LysR family regulator
MEMHQIRYFLAVCSECNFTRAAKLCHVSQPSLTRAIKLLEAELGGLLFRREHTQSRLTELGEIVRPHLQQVWEQSYAAVTQAHEFAATGRASLKIGIMCTIAPSLLIGLLARVRSRRSRIGLEIVHGTAGDLEEQLVGGHLAAAIYGKPGNKIDTRLDRTPLFRERMMIAMLPDHDLARRVSIGISDLAGQPFIRRTQCEYNELVGRLFKRHRLECEVAFDCARDDWAQALIACGLGLALLPKHSIDHPSLAARPLVEPELWREVSLFTSRERRRGEALHAFVEEARQALATSKAAPATNGAAE